MIENERVLNRSKGMEVDENRKERKGHLGDSDGDDSSEILLNFQHIGEFHFDSI